MEARVILVVLASYILGAIPFGYLMGRARGIDITREGSGNIGATNAFRILGPVPGLIVLLADAAKGYIAAYIGQRYGGSEVLAILGGGVAVLAHSYSVFLRFKGGRGVACAAGVLLRLMPVVVTIELAIWIVTIAITKYVSVGSILVAGLLPLVIWLDGNPLPYLVFGVLAGVFVIYKHRANIERLRAGTEHRFGAPRE